MGDEQPNAQVSGSHKDRLVVMRKAAHARDSKGRSSILRQIRGAAAGKELASFQRELREAGASRQRSSILRSAEQASASVRRREVKVHRALATDRFFGVLKAKATPVAYTALVVTKKTGTRSVQKVAAKPARRPVVAKPNVEGPAKPVLTGSTSLVGFFRSGQGDLSQTVKERAREKKGTGQERSGSIGE